LGQLFTSVVGKIQMRIIGTFLLSGIISLSLSCTNSQERQEEVAEVTKTSLVVLGNVQDAGYPQIGCTKACCVDQWGKTAEPKMVTSLGLVDGETRTTWLFDASPDFKYQTKLLSDYAGNDSIVLPQGIFLTHGHIGHYTGLMQLGREAINAQEIPVYAMPRMGDFLRTSGPWSQLLKLNNIVIEGLSVDSAVQLTESLRVVPFLVPHRAEFTETVGYRIEGASKSALFIPDIDKWHLWERDIRAEIGKVDIAFLDATFYQNGEVGNRDMSEIPHPFVEESMQLFDELSEQEKRKVYFIHFNHTNPLLQEGSEARREVLARGYNIAQEGFTFEL
ncbi:MAG: MBL fold metallo-hydrolase, partial [Bacteroidota bacterium]